MQDFFIYRIFAERVNINHQFTFKKEEKLKSRKLIEQLFKKGRSFSNFPLKVIYLLKEDKAEPLQAGFTVSNKIFKKAVDRNKIKRLMREAYRFQKNELRDTLSRQNKSMAVFFIYTGNEIPKYQNVADKINLTLKKLNKIVDEAAAENT